MGGRLQREKAINCVICKKGEIKPGNTTITLERDGAIWVFKSVPARVCEICGEAYVGEEITDRLLKSAEDAARSGIQVEIRQYSAA